MHTLQTYLAKQQTPVLETLASPVSAMCMTVVIPCYDEPEVLLTLRSLSQCHCPNGHVEVLLVVNHKQDSPDVAVAQNQKTIAEVKAWAHELQLEWLTIHVIAIGLMVGKHAGVGLARKIGLDLATARFESIKKHGLLLNLDADCTVSLDYFTQVQSAFASKKMPAGHCQFAHALTGELDEPIYQGIARYELYLRYYQNALAYAGSPYAMYTIGSCIVVTTKAYAQSGGMNRRQAGEDFYFLQKLRGMGEVASISAMVYPSTRYSNRVPFGTGKAIEQWVEGDKEGYLTMPFQAFEDLKQLYLAVEWVYHNPEKYPEISVVMQAFLQQQQFLSKVQGMRLNSRAFKAFKKHFQHWLNGFMCLKFIHFSEAECYPQEELLAVAEVLLQKLGQKVPERDYQSQLLAFRRWDAKLEKSATYQV